jgi:drug/metabolite transporter (DMT)-like permease
MSLIIFIWGANWPVLKIILREITPLWLACARLFLGAGTIFLFQLASRQRINLPSRADLPIILSVGILQMAAVIALINIGLQHVPAGRSAILCYTMSLWTAPGAVIFLGERLTLPKITAVILGMVGVATMFNPFSFDWSDQAALIGNGCLLLAAAIWAATILHIQAHHWQSSPLALAPWQMLAGLVPLTLLAVGIEGSPPLPSLSVHTLEIAFYIGPVITAFAYWASITVTRSLPAVTTSLAYLLVPIIGVLSAALITAESVPFSTIAGLILILSGIAINTLAKSYATSRR